MPNMLNGGLKIFEHKFLTHFMAFFDVLARHSSFTVNGDLCVNKHINHRVIRQHAQIERATKLMMTGGQNAI